MFPPHTMELGSHQYDLGSASGQSFNGSSRKTESVVSSRGASCVSASKAIKECARDLTDVGLFTRRLEDWVVAKSSNGIRDPFKPPFRLHELQSLDFALESVLFQQLHRMPRPTNASKADEFLALEDFLHAVSESLRRTFWDGSGPSPFSVSCPRYPGSKFDTVENAISRGRLDSLCGAALASENGNGRARWDEVVQFALFRRRVTVGNELTLCSSSICEALFFAVRMLLFRTLRKYGVVGGDCVYVLVLDSGFGGVVKVEGDVGKLKPIAGDPYSSVANWVKHHAEVSVSPVDRIWNELGNANWRDFGTLQVLLATFYSLVRWSGEAKTSIESLASDHALRLHQRRMERRVAVEGEKTIIPFDRQVAVECEKTIIPFDRDEEIVDVVENSNDTRLKLKKGDVLEVEDQLSHEPRRFRVHEPLHGCRYGAFAPEHPTETLTLYVGAHPSRLEPSWEDMSLWYQVQRQTKVLNVFREHQISSENLPRVVAHGRIAHPGPCTRPSPKGRCDHPLCGTPVLVASPVGEPLSTKAVPFAPADAVRCGRDCLAALGTAKSADVQHGDVCPENVIITSDVNRGCCYVLASWGRAVLADKDACPAVNLRFSSAHALQHGKLCPSADAESLVYLLYYVCGGRMPSRLQVDSIESALSWRRKRWAKRAIQRHLGEASSVLKAFADYVDGLRGTPYAVDYDVWVRRFDWAVEGFGGGGKAVDRVVRLEDTAESSRIGDGSP